VASMPLFTAPGERSVATASICLRTSSTGTASHALTPTGFCAVIAVIAEVQNTPNWWKVLRSAWIPAPPPESEPAIVRATCIYERCDNGTSDVGRRTPDAGRRTRVTGD